MFEKSTSDARTDTETHRCLAGEACRAHTVVDGRRLAKLTETANTLCDVCTEHHRSAIRRLPRDWAMLYVTLGERQAGTGDYVKSSSTPAILINTTSDRIMVDIIEWADQAAAIVSDQLNTDQPTGSRTLPGRRDKNGKVVQAEAEEGSLAQRTWDDMTQPHVLEALKAFIGIVEPHIDKLAATEAQPVMVWLGPARCDDHYNAIALAENLLEVATPESRPALLTDLERARLAAATCNDCNGWSADGRSQARELVDYTGLQILEKLTTLHQLTRKHLGHTKLRHRYSMPCPNCHSMTVGRDNGQTIVDCQTCHYSWTQREYRLLEELVLDDEMENTVFKPQLDEANTRLDKIQDIIATLDADDIIDQPGAGTIILGALKTAMDGHQPPDQRSIGTDQQTTTTRQASEDNWAPNEKPYTPPKAKRKRTRATPDFPKVAASSRSVLNDDITYLPDAIDRPAKVCKACNLVHAGECA